MRRKTLLVGWDAADWKMITPLIEAGRMPHLAKMIEEGSSGNLATLQPCFSPMLWTSIATGKRAHKHGILGFTEIDPTSGFVRPISNLSRKTKAVWNIFNQEGKNTITVGWWPSHPPEPLSRGVMVSNRYQRSEGSAKKDDWEMPEACVHPERLAPILEELHFHPSELSPGDLSHFVPALDEMTLEEKKELINRGEMQSLMKIIGDCTSINSAATGLMQNEPWDLMCVYFDAIDHFGHGFMKYHPPKLDHVREADFKLFSRVNAAGYEYHDMMLGTLLRQAGDDCNVILISDHGFHPDEARLKYIPREHAGPAREHREYGIFVARGPEIRAGQQVVGASLLDVCPTILHLNGLAVGEDMDGRVLHEIMADSRGISSIPSWDQVEGDDGCHTADTKLDEAADEEALEQLVALGYIEKPVGGKEKAAAQTRAEHQQNLATSYMDGGLFGAAIDILEPLYHEFPQEHQLGFKLASCYQKTKRIRKLKALVPQMLERRLQEKKEAEEEVEKIKAREEELLKEKKDPLEGKSDQEKRAYHQNLRQLYQKLRPNLYSFQHLMAVVDFAEGRYEEVLAKTENLDRDLSAKSSSLRLRAFAFSRLKRYEEAIEVLDLAASIEPESAANSLGLARQYLRAKKPQVALEYIDRSIALNFQRGRAHYLRGYILLSLNKPEEAKEALKVAIKLAPGSPSAYRLLALILKRVDRDYIQATRLIALAKSLKKQSLLGKARRSRIQGPTDVNKSALQPRIPLNRSLLTDAESVSSKEVITVVSGLPRSGTSLMMQVLEFAGIEPFSDKVRTPDESNQRGYYEHLKILELDKRTPKAWLLDARGKSIKVVAPLIPMLPSQVKNSSGNLVTLHYRILFMERPIEDIIESQSKMIARLASGPQVQDQKKLAQNLRAYENRARKWCQRSGIPAVGLSLYDFVDGSPEELAKFSALLQRSISAPDLKKVVDQRLLTMREQSATEEK
ncbi:alkaline phosphatase family protein [Roseibacillus persicicus]|uniref:alkaline phosphatase family protein n=1 Tax=Roseibacillus persicicus TaxID=454148 RepID=UPI00398BAA1B